MLNYNNIQVSTKVLNKNQILKVLFSLKSKKVTSLLRVLSQDQNEEKLTFIEQHNFTCKSDLIEWVYNSDLDIKL